MKIAVAVDHAGFPAKGWLVEHLEAQGHPVADFGTDSTDPVDYPDVAVAAARAVSEGACDRAILVCGTGIGMSMVANKVPGVRAAACQSPDAARLSRAHNDANALCLGARLTPAETMRQIVDTWLTTDFEGGRHARRVRKIDALDEEHAT